MLQLAWEKFESGDYKGAEALYLACLQQTGSADAERYSAVLMGLVYTESFLEKYDEARRYGRRLLQEAKNAADQHVALHQLGMVERMAGNLPEAMRLFLEEERVICASFPDDDLRLAANLYEQAYVVFKRGELSKAEGVMRASLDRAAAAKDEMCMGCSFRGLGEILKAAGRADEAGACFGKAIAAFTKAGDGIAVEEIRNML